MRIPQLFCCMALLSCVGGFAQSVGNITTVAGTGISGYSGDGGLSVSANLFYPFGVAVDSIADTGDKRIRRVTLR